MDKLLEFKARLSLFITRLKPIGFESSLTSRDIRSHVDLFGGYQLVEFMKVKDRKA